MLSKFLQPLTVAFLIANIGSATPLCAQNTASSTSRDTTYYNNNWQSEIVSKHPGSSKFFWIPLYKTVSSRSFISKKAYQRFARPEVSATRKADRSRLASRLNLSSGAAAQVKPDTQATLIYAPTSSGQIFDSGFETARHVSGRILSDMSSRQSHR